MDSDTIRAPLRSRLVNGEAGLGEFNVSTVLHRLINKPRRHVIMYDLHDFFFSKCLYKSNHAITGSSALDVLWKGRCELRDRQVHLSFRFSFRVEEPAHPHITFGYRNDKANERERLSSSSLASLTGEQFKDVGMKCLGDRQNVLNHAVQIVQLSSMD